MTDWEKLVKLINHVSEGHIINLMQPGGAEELADYLIANGVTVKESQKPLTVEAMKELWKKRNSEIVWLEDYTGMILDVKIWTINTQEVWFEKDVNEIYAPLSTHGRKWRCWIEKPTEEERETAEWE